jgi:pimeloyl-ACP methyl ester carboxylesterase
MRTRSAWLVLMMVAWVMACGGEESTGGRGGGDEDVSEVQDVDDAETGDTTKPEVAADVAPDPVPEVAADALPEAAEAEPETVEDTATPDVPPTPTITWGACPSYIGNQAECAFVPLPFDFQDPESEDVEVFIFRVSGGLSSKGQIWFLQGGPGGSGADFAPLFEQLVQVFPGWDFYSIDHRGVGNTARLSCPQEGPLMGQPGDFDTAGCAAHLTETWGEHLDTFSTTHAAHDLGVLIEGLRPEDGKVFVYGGSYGTYWAERYLQLFPHQADGVIMDSLAMPEHCWIDDYDYWFNEVGKQVLGHCDGDSDCADHMTQWGATTVEAAQALYASVDEGQVCPIQGFAFDRPTLRTWMALFTADPYLRVLMPPIFHRLARCAPEDQAVLGNLVMNLSQMMGGYLPSLAPDYVGEDETYSMVLGEHVIQSEMFRGRTMEEALEVIDGALISPDTTPLVIGIHDSGEWPIYEDDGYMQRWAETDVPILMMNGMLDPQTPLEIALPAADKHAGPHQTFLTFPYAAHGVIMSSTTNAAMMGYGMPCGMEIMFDFIDDPTGELDLSCMDDLYPLEFNPHSQMNQMLADYLMGTYDMWDGEAYRPTGAATPYFKRLVLESVRRTAARIMAR